MPHNGLKLIAIVLSASIAAQCQRNREYDNVVVKQTRIDARDLGHPPIDVIPDGESGITSLALAPDGTLFGATSGNHAHLFALVPRQGYVVPLGVLQNVDSVVNAVAVSASGDVFIGASPSGHILQVSPFALQGKQQPIDAPLPVTDLGQAIAGQSIATLICDRVAGTLYGLTAPDGHFFEYAIATRKFTDFGVVAHSIPPGERFQRDKTMSRVLALDQKGNVFASGEDGFFYRFDPRLRKLEKLSIQVPAVPGREPWTRVDAFLLDPSGIIYGGTSDGYLFRLDPVKLTITNLGKPLNQYGIGGLVQAPSGKLYGVGGDKDEMARLFSYDASTGAYNILGFIDVNRPPYYTWQAYVIGAMAADADGTIFIGENERISKLYLFYPPQ